MSCNEVAPPACSSAMIGAILLAARSLDARVLDRNVQSSKIAHAALLLLMLEARNHGDLVSPSA
jgi:hypothetical protein